MVSSAARTVRALGSAMAHLTGDPPPTLGSTPRDQVFCRDKLVLYRIRSRTRGVPVLLIPPLMVRPYIYDLSRTHSMLGTLRDAGFDTFLIDFGVPERGDERIRLDDYVLDWVPSCIDRTLRASGASQVAVVGYCMGGLFGLIHVGTLRDERVRALVTIGSPVNFSRLGIMSFGARWGAPLVEATVQLMGNIPGSVSSMGFKLLTLRRTLLNYLRLAANIRDEEYVDGFRAINYWINDLIPYPKEAFLQMFRDVVLGNKLLHNELVFGDRRCDLQAVSCSLLAFAGEQDTISPPEAIKEIVDLVGSQDKQFVVAPGGHVGLVAGSSAPASVWRPLVEWLGERMPRG